MMSHGRANIHSVGSSMRYAPNPLTSAHAGKPEPRKIIVPSQINVPEPESLDDDAFVEVDLHGSTGTSISRHSSLAGEHEVASCSALGTFQIQELARMQAVSVGELELSIQFGEHENEQAVMIVHCRSAVNFPAYHGISDFSKQHTKVYLDVCISFERAREPLQLRSQSRHAGTSMMFDEQLVAIMSQGMFERRRAMRVSVMEKKLSGKKVLGHVLVDITRLTLGHCINSNRYRVFNERSRSTSLPQSNGVLAGRSSASLNRGRVRGSQSQRAASVGSIV